MSQRLRQPLGTVSYHVRELERAGAIELVGEEKVRGAIAHRYRCLVRPTLEEAEWAALDDSERACISSQVLANIISEAYAALTSGTLDSRTDRHLTWRWISLDEQGWKELMDVLHHTFFGLVDDVESRCLTRCAKRGEAPGIKGIVSMLGFERSPLGPVGRTQGPR